MPTGRYLLRGSRFRSNNANDGAAIPLTVQVTLYIYAFVQAGVKNIFLRAVLSKTGILQYCGQLIAADHALDLFDIGFATH